MWSLERGCCTLICRGKMLRNKQKIFDFDLEITSNNTDSAAVIPVKFLLSLQINLARSLFSHSQQVFGGLDLWMLCQESSFLPIKRGDPRYVYQIFEDFYPTFGVFSPPKKSPRIHRVLARAGRFCQWIILFFLDQIWPAGLKEKGDLEVSALGGFDWRKFQIRVSTLHTKKLLRIILSQLLKSWKERMKAWREYESCSNIYPLRKLTCPMKNSGWTTFDPLFRWRCAAHKMQRRPSTWAMQWHGCQLPPWVTATGGRHVEVLKQTTSPISCWWANEIFLPNDEQMSSWTLGEGELFRAQRWQSQRALIFFKWMVDAVWQMISNPVVFVFFLTAFFHVSTVLK